MKELIKNLEELNRKAEKGGGDARIETALCGQADRP